MEDNTKELIKQKNSRISVVLIVVNTILVLILANAGAGADSSEDQTTRNQLLCLACLVVLLGGYAFSYHGKGYRLGKWLFVIALLTGLVFFGLLWYATQLGKAFQH